MNRTSSHAVARRRRAGVRGLTCSARSSGCRCSRLHGEVDDVAFTRCGQVAAPEGAQRPHCAARAVAAGACARHQSARGSARGRLHGTRRRSAIAHGCGAAGGQKPGLVLLLGGLGDDVGAASANLAALSALRVPTVFIAGGADRAAGDRGGLRLARCGCGELLLHGSGLRELRIGKERFAVVSGSPLGRYALDDEACGFAADRLGRGARGARCRAASLAAHLAAVAGLPRRAGVISNAAGVDVGSPELFALAQALSAQGGLFAYPETQAGMVVRDEKPRSRSRSWCRASAGPARRALMAVGLQAQFACWCSAPMGLLQHLDRQGFGATFAAL